MENEEKNLILAEMAFFDMFDFPLTEEEIFLFFPIKSQPENISQFLDSLLTEGRIKKDRNYYCLMGREQNLIVRNERKKYFLRKLKRAQRVALLFRFIPWIKMIAISNVIGSENLKNESDIDLFIIVKEGHLWLTRLLAAGLMKIFGLRPKVGHEKDKICLNFFLSDNHFNIKSFMLESGDIYFPYWLVGLVPIYNISKTFEKFIASNSWLFDYFPNYRLDGKTVQNNKLSKLYTSVWNKILGRFEQRAKKLQIKILPPELKEAMNKDTAVVINNDVLKLHSKDRRLYYKNIFNERLNKLNANNK